MNIKFFLVLILFLQEITYPQYKKEAPEIRNYIDMLDSLKMTAEVMHKINKNTDPVKYIIERMNEDELKHIAATMFKASDCDHILLMDSTYKSSGADKDPFNRIRFENLIQQEIKNSISPVVFALTRVAYFLKIKVHRIESEISKEEFMPKFPMINVDAYITEVFKGNGRYKAGENIEFYFYLSWLPTNKNFEIGKEYFVALEPRGTGGIPPKVHNITALVVYLDESKGYYPIIDNYLIDENNFFNMGNKIQYDLFRKELNKKIEEIKSW